MATHQPILTPLSPEQPDPQWERLDTPSFLRHPRHLAVVEADDGVHTGIVGEPRFVDTGEPVPTIHIYTPVGQLKWSTTVPTKAGWYWLRHPDGDREVFELRPGEVFIAEGLSFAGPLRPPL